MNNNIEVYTDGSCNTQYRIGGWSAIIFISNQKVTLSGNELETTNQRMELTAVIKALSYIVNVTSITDNKITVYTDSQYIVHLVERKHKLEEKKYLTKKGDAVRNADLVKTFFTYTENYPVEITKVKAHQKLNQQPGFNREADKLSRKIVRELVASQKNK